MLFTRWDPETKKHERKVWVEGKHVFVMHEISPKAKVLTSNKAAKRSARTLWKTLKKLSGEEYFSRACLWSGEQSSSATPVSADQREVSEQGATTVA
jgi:hypothetical protein